MGYRSAMFNPADQETARIMSSITGASMAVCLEALQKTGGDMMAAWDLLPGKDAPKRERTKPETKAKPTRVVTAPPPPPVPATAPRTRRSAPEPVAYVAPRTPRESNLYPLSGEPTGPLRASAKNNPVEFDTSRASPIKEMKKKFAETALGPWLPGNRSRLTKTGAKLKPLVRVILPDINNRFTADQVRPEPGVVKILASAENPGPHELKGVNFWHRLFDDPYGMWWLIPQNASSEEEDDLSATVRNLPRLRNDVPYDLRKSIDKRLADSAYVKRVGQPVTLQDFQPSVRTNRPSAGWNTSEDVMADEMASVLGYERGLKLSIIPHRFQYLLRKRIKQGMTYSQAVNDLARHDLGETEIFFLPTESELAELSAIVRPAEEYAEYLIQTMMGRAAEVGLVMIFEQPNAARGTKLKKGSDPNYTSVRDHVNQLMRSITLPRGWRWPGGWQ